MELGTITGEGNDAVTKFDRFYVCLASLRRTWLAHCRPIIGIYGCHLKNDVKGILLVAIGRDANNQLFPIAWSIVPVENIESWLWFIKLLKKDLNLDDGSGFMLIQTGKK